MTYSDKIYSELKLNLKTYKIAYVIYKTLASGLSKMIPKNLMGF